MKLIADSGSTKTDWALVNAGGAEWRWTAGGLNPSVMDEGALEKSLKVGLLVELERRGVARGDIGAIRFFSAGCTEKKSPLVANLLKGFFPQASDVVVASDMLGAAIAACEGREGIAAILGTGSNSCLTDGERVIANTPALGFILGDEGSGAVLGKMFLNRVLKGTLPKALSEKFLATTGLDRFAVIERVYRQAEPNRFLASFSPFIRENLAVEELHQLVVDNFRAFFRNNIRQYARADLKVSVVGSMGYYFETELREAAEDEGFSIGRIIKSPIDGLVEYYKQHE